MENEAMKPANQNNQVSSNKFEWFSEYVRGLDQSIGKLQQMVDQLDGEPPKQSELNAHIQEISDGYRLITDHFDRLTGELNQQENAATKKATSDPQQTPPFQTPKKTLSMLYSDTETPGFDLSLSGGDGSSDMTRSEFSLVSSESDSESCNSSLPKMVDHTEQEQEQCYVASHKGECGECGILKWQISDYVKELEVSNDKLRVAEEEILKLKNEVQDNAAVMVNVRNLESSLAAAKNEIKLHEAEAEEESKRSLVLQRQVVDLEARLESEQQHTLELQAVMKKHETDLSSHEAEIRRLTSELQDASGSFALEKWQLESSIAELSAHLKSNEIRAKDLEAERDSLTVVIKKYEASKIEMEEKHEAMRINWQDEMQSKNAMVDALNRTLDAVKVERDEADAKLGKAKAEISQCNDWIKCLERNLHVLGCENKQVIAEKGQAEKEIMELKSRIEVLEKEVGVQAMKTEDVAEEKREAIRQLCLSIDHFKTAYEEAREAYVSRVQSRAVAV